jgi:putative ABC transport system permease protein
LSTSRHSGVALVSYALWQGHFGGSATALGTTFRLDQRTFTLIGVLPQGYAFPYDAQDWVPTVLDPGDCAGFTSRV